MDPWLQAAIQAFPLASEAAYRQVTLHVGSRSPWVPDDSTEDLAEELEGWSRQSAAGMSLDQLALHRDRAWLGDTAGKEPLGRYLRRTSLRYLEPRAGVASIRDGADVDLRWLTLSLPNDLVAVGSMLGSSTEPRSDSLDVSTLQLRTVLDRPVAETHVHLSAAMSFRSVWAGLSRSLAGGQIDLATLKSLAGIPFGGPDPYLRCLSTAFVVRLLLARFLRSEAVDGAANGLRTFVQSDYLSFAAQVQWPFGGEDFLRVIAEAVGAYCTGRPPPGPLASIRSLLRAMLGPSTERLSRDPCTNDPMASWLPSLRGCSPEGRFAWRALSYVDGVGSSDELFATLFWQYQRVRCLTFRLLVEEPGTPGFDWFRCHFSRTNPLRPSLRSNLLSMALTEETRGIRLMALEGRVAPEDDRASYSSEFQALARQAADHLPPDGRSAPEVGLIVHFVKDGRQRGCRDPAHPVSSADGWRMGRWVRREQARARALAACLDARPEWLQFVRGIDTANFERSVPTWPTVALLRDLRDRSESIVARSLGGLSPLRVTCHAGEDWWWLVDGLRRVAELLDFGVLLRGDRVGHGVAVGLSPYLAAAGRSFAVQPADERLDDLLWVIELVRAGKLDLSASKLEQVRATALTLANEIFASRHDLDVLLAARRRRHNPHALNRLRFNEPNVGPATDDVDEALLLYLRCERTYERGRQPVDIRLDDEELAMVEQIQKIVCRDLGRLEITIETNPTSNLLIGGLPDIRQHPVFRLRPLATSDGAMLVSVSTDNPLTFSTSLGDEYGWLYMAMLRGGIAAETALTWIDRVRDCGWRSRFTVPASADRDVLSRLGASVYASGS